MSAATGPDICDLIQLTLILVDMMTAIASAALWAVGTALGVAGLWLSGRRGDVRAMAIAPKALILALWVD